MAQIRASDIRTLALLTIFLGAELGANDHRLRDASSHYHCSSTTHQATPSTLQARFESAS